MSSANTDTTTTTTTTTTTQPPPLSLTKNEELQKVFNQFDSNKDGKISISELHDALKSLNFSSTTTTYTISDLQRVMEDIDTDRDGFISLSEFAALCRSSSDSASELRDAFDLYDENKDGLISASELHQVMNRIGLKCSLDECVKMITSVDSDGDGSVSFDEFQIMMANNVASSNGGGSGSV